MRDTRLPSSGGNGQGQISDLLEAFGRPNASGACAKALAARVENPLQLALFQKSGIKQDEDDFHFGNGERKGVNGILI